MSELNLGPECLPDIRKELHDNENECLNHINSYTFSEKTFVDYFNYLNSYTYILANNSGLPELYDASNLARIAGYYNTHTNTNNHYDEHTGKKSQVEIYYRPVYTSSEKDENNSKNGEEFDKKKLYLIALALGVAILLIHRCSHAEEIDTKKLLDMINKKKIEFEDSNFTMNDIEDEVISSRDYPVLCKKLKK